ncbi:MAG: hypothetical protein AAFX94_23190, partial [Myxococcota bacterium]
MVSNSSLDASSLLGTRTRTLPKWAFGIFVFLGLLAVAYLGLPSLLHALGLHPSYDMPVYNLEGKRALVITTSHGTL